MALQEVECKIIWTFTAPEGRKLGCSVVILLQPEGPGGQLPAPCILGGHGPVSVCMHNYQSVSVPVYV